MRAKRLKLVRNRSSQALTLIGTLFAVALLCSGCRTPRDAEAEIAASHAAVDELNNQRAHDPARQDVDPTTFHRRP